MKNTTESMEIITCRKNLYNFLGRIYQAEVEPCLLEQLKAIKFPFEGGEGELEEGYRLLENFLRSPGPDPITDLTLDYARVFLGTYGGPVANPYESVYIRPERAILRETRDEIVAAYRMEGLDKTETLIIPEYHISREFEFMAYLCQETLEFIEDQDWHGIIGSLIDQIDFLGQHLTNWIPDFCADIEKCAKTKFYRAVAKITKGFLSQERTFLEDLISETMFEVAHN